MRATSSHGALVAIAFAAVAMTAPMAHAGPDASGGPPSASPGQAGAHVRRLENGLTVIVEEDHRTPLVSLVLRYDVGERAASPGLHGTAALTQALASYATQHVPAGDASRLLWRAGATFSDATYADYSALNVTLPATRLALPLWVWSDQMGFFPETMDDARFREKRDDLAGWKKAQRTGTPLANIDSIADEELFPPQHPYHEAYGTPDSVARIRFADVVEFHDRWMTPDHATLVVVGDVAAADAFAQVERYFGPIPASTGRGRIPALPVPELAGETLVEAQARVPAARLFVRWPTPRFMTTDDARLDVVASLLTGRSRALLSWELVGNKKVAAYVWAGQRSRSLASEFAVYIEGAPGKTATEVLAAFDGAMDALLARPLEQLDVDHAVYDTIVERAYGWEAASTRASEYAKYQAAVGSPSYLLRDLARFEGITPSVVSDALKRLLPRDRRVVVLVSPSPAATPAGERVSRRTVPARQP